MSTKSTDLHFDAEEKTVTAAGTKEPLKVGPPNEVSVLSVTIKALSTNTGKIYIGGHGVASTNGMDLDPRDSHDLAGCLGHLINLSEVWIDADVSGEGVRFDYLRL